MVTRTFGEEAWRLTLNEIVFFIGSILGGSLISVWGGFKNKIHTLALRLFFMWSIWYVDGNCVICKYVYNVFNDNGFNGFSNTVI